MPLHNTGYILLGAIQKVTGITYAECLQKNAFGPLDMNDSGYGTSAAVIKNRTMGYAQGGRLNALYLDMSLPHTVGSLYSTVGDLLKSDEALCTKRLIKRGAFAKDDHAGIE